MPTPSYNSKEHFELNKKAVDGVCVMFGGKRGGVPPAPHGALGRLRAAP